MISVFSTNSTNSLSALVSLTAAVTSWAIFLGDSDNRKIVSTSSHRFVARPRMSVYLPIVVQLTGLDRRQLRIDSTKSLSAAVSLIAAFTSLSNFWGVSAALRRIRDFPLMVWRKRLLAPVLGIRLGGLRVQLGRSHQLVHQRFRKGLIRARPVCVSRATFLDWASGFGSIAAARTASRIVELFVPVPVAVFASLVRWRREGAAAGDFLLGDCLISASQASPFVFLGFVSVFFSSPNLSGTGDSASLTRSASTVLRLGFVAAGDRVRLGRRFCWRVRGVGVLGPRFGLGHGVSSRGVRASVAGRLARLVQFT